MGSLVSERSGGKLVEYAFDIYLQCFVTVFSFYVALVLPFGILEEFLQYSGAYKLSSVVLLLGILARYFAGIALTFLVSDIYLGNSPNLKYAISRITLRLFSKVLFTELLFEFIIVVCFFLLIVPSVIFYAWFMFGSVVAVLEGIWGIKALKRSKDLGRNYYLRNLFVMFLPYSIYLLAKAVALYLLTKFSGPNWLWLSIGTALLLCLIEPVLIMRTVLLYYDMRIRQEAYDLVAMPEELKL